jgi:murein DD-endopeptidase MepM/ murein hydrolase activator NlpD
MRFTFLLIILLFLAAPAHAQPAIPFCGVVDAVDYPITDLVEGYDDFALFRARFGGNHVGIDIGFDRWGDPVRAAARGRVTYANPEGWDTEKGVIIVEHTFPDNSIGYSLYGHVEQTDTIFLPRVGECVERGEVIAAIGWPSRGRPHLHYEWRNFMPDDGGPGYVVDNPLDHGWYNPMDFTALWRARLTPAYRDSVTFDAVSNVPPVQLSGGGYAIASSDVVSRIAANGTVAWRIQTDGVITGLAALSGDRIVVHTANGQAATLQEGRFTALWTVDGPEIPFVAFGQTLVFVTEGNGLAAYNPDGSPLWTLPGEPGRILLFEATGGQMAMAIRGESGISWRVIDAAGGVFTRASLDDFTAAAPRLDGSWMVLAGTTLRHISPADNREVARVSPPPGRTARLSVDAVGNTYIYLGDGGSNLLAFTPSGELRWRATYPVQPDVIAPLVTVGNGCLLYTLDSDGMLNSFNTADGALVNQLQLYAGGARNGNPGSRLLWVDASEQVYVAGGYLTVLTLDGMTFGNGASC